MRSRISDSALGVYGRMLMAQARGQAQYRASFLADLGGSVLASLVDLLAIVVLFQVTKTLGGFDFAESFLMATLAACGFSLSEFFVGGIDRIRFHVRTGLLDALLIRPLGSLGQLIVMDFSPRRTGRTVMTAVMLAIAAHGATLAWGWQSVLLIVITPFASGLLFASMFVATATVTFWWIDSHEFANSVTYGGREFTSYPMTVFGQSLRMLFGYGLGYGFAGYYPALTLLNHPDPLGLPSWTGWCSSLVAVAFAALASVVWRIGIRHYRSTGS